MKHSEELAYSFLSSLGFSKIVYEPDGNVPPDFLIDDRIAVEVRRLNRHVKTPSGEYCGLENDEFRVHECIRGILAKLGPPTGGHSWFVHYEFSRPIPPLGSLRREVKKFLSDFKEGRTTEKEFQLCEQFSIEIAPSSMTFAHFFVVGGCVDDEAGGWLIPDLKFNVNICVAEKDRKISKFRLKYQEWWLLLIDHVGYGVRENFSVPHDWAKVVLVNPLNPLSAYEVTSSE